MGADHTPDGPEPSETPTDPESIDWANLPLDDPRWDLIDELPDDDDEPRIPPDPSQRDWRHPSEVAAANAHMERSRAEDARTQHPSSLQQTEAATHGNRLRLIAGIAASALILAGLTIVRSGGDTIREETAASLTTVIATTAPPAAPETIEAELAPIIAPEPEPAASPYRSVNARTILAAPSWAYEVLSGADSQTATLATAVRLDGLDSALLVSSASALAGRVDVTLASHSPLSIVPTLSTAEVIGTDAASDIAVLRMIPQGSVAASAPLGSDAHDQPGSAVEIRPGTAVQRHSGTILAASEDRIETSAPVPAGHLGAALVNSHGRVTGIVVNGPSLLAVAIPVAEAVRIAGNISEFGYANPNWLGVTVTSTDGLVEVVDVVEGGPAATAGISTGDLLIGLADTLILTPEQLQSMVADHPAGQPLDMVVRRAGDVVTLAVEMGQRPKAADIPTWIET